MNTASGNASTVPGGQSNSAVGSFSSAAGQRAKANHAGAFVWADSTAADFVSTGINQFLIRATGGVGIGANNPANPLDVNGIIRSRTGGFKFPDGTIQTTAATGGAAGWALAGNGGTDPAANFVGTTDNQPLCVRVNNTRVMRYEPNATSPNIIGGWNGNSVTTGALGATIAGGGSAEGGALQNRVTDNYGAIGGGMQNTAGDNAGSTGDARFATVGGGLNNTASGEGSTVGGGCHHTSSGEKSTVGGGIWNAASGDFATIAGGYDNDASGLTSTVGGGVLNIASGNHSTIGGGWQNTASGPDTSTVGGGTLNVASGENSTVGGGRANTASGEDSTIGGGRGNIASGPKSVVPGGVYNTASGDFSFAAGRKAKASHLATFVWADSTDADFASTGNSQFLVRAAGGVGINKNNPGTALDVNGTATMTGFSMPTGASAGYVLTSNGSGVGSWQALGLGAYWSLLGNAGTVDGTNFLGTTDNVALDFRVDDERAFRIEPNATSPNIIGGFNLNSVTAGAYGATIAGGGNAAERNCVTDNYGAIGGGAQNTAGDNAGSTEDARFATVGGGLANIARGQASTVGGGLTNIASGGWSTVGGGHWNWATSDDSTVGGGVFNLALGSMSTVPGGQMNAASGLCSLAAGSRAQASHEGAFVWADHSGAFDFASTWVNEFSARATGGVRFVSAIDGSGNPTAGVSLAPGGVAWSAISDRNLKANFAKIDSREVLRKLADLDITTWNMKSQDPSIRHIGPMAQDFAAAFKVGEDDRHITTTDADGVALAAIKGLHESLQEKEALISELQKQNSGLVSRLAALEQRVTTLEDAKKR